MQHTHYRIPHELKKLRILIEWTRDFFKDCGYHEPKDIRVLEVGCGTGNISVPLASLGYSVVGTDLDQKSIQYLTSLNVFKNARFEVYDVDLNPYTSHERFDVVILSEVLEHLRNPVRGLDHVSSVLREGGLLLLTTPNGFGPYEITNKMEQDIRSLVKPIVRVLNVEKIWIRRRDLFLRDQTVSTFNQHSPHLQRFTIRFLSESLKHTGFRVEEWRCSNIVSFGALGNIPYFSNIDCRLADLMPRILVSGWYLRCVKQ
jgi:2-polyprenyl-3-methyl-5-hydroxy-6-metoxy-1,4-benzoquinol methylase